MHIASTNSSTLFVFISDPPCRFIARPFPKAGNVSNATFVFGLPREEIRGRGCAGRATFFAASSLRWAAQNAPVTEGQAKSERQQCPAVCPCDTSFQPYRI